jgi:hypothetical protein
VHLRQRIQALEDEGAAEFGDAEDGGSADFLYDSAAHLRQRFQALEDEGAAQFGDAEDKFAGQRGYQFTEWAKEFLDAAAGKGDEDASWADCYLGQDPQAGLTAVQTRRRTQRRRESYSALLQHMDDDSLKAVIRAEAGPLAVNPQDRSNGRVAWLVIRRECEEPASALHINTKILEYNGLTILKDVGVTEATITDFNRLIVKKNSDLPIANRFSDDSMTEKMLGAIIIPPTLAQAADSLLQ